MKKKKIVRRVRISRKKIKRAKKSIGVVKKQRPPLPDKDISEEMPPWND